MSLSIPDHARSSVMQGAQMPKHDNQPSVKQPDIHDIGLLSSYRCVEGTRSVITRSTVLGFTVSLHGLGTRVLVYLALV